MTSPTLIATSQRPGGLSIVLSDCNLQTNRKVAPPRSLYPRGSLFIFPTTLKSHFSLPRTLCRPSHTGKLVGRPHENIHFTFTNNLYSLISTHIHSHPTHIKKGTGHPTYTIRNACLTNHSTTPRHKKRKGGLLLCVRVVLLFVCLFVA